MTARDYLIKTDINIRIAIENGYDIRLDESEILEKMEGYHQAKLKLLNICIISDLKKDLLAEIKMSCDGTYSDNPNSWDFTETVESVINRINKTLDKYFK